MPQRARDHRQPTASPVSADLVPLCAVFRRFLKAKGLKFTAERASILDAVLNEDGVFEVDELMYKLHQAGHHVSKATIYRTIKQLVEARIIEEILLDSHQAHYRLAFGRESVDHLICEDDDQVIAFREPDLDAIVRRVCAEHGMEPTGHRLLIYATRNSRG